MFFVFHTKTLGPACMAMAQTVLELGYCNMDHVMQFVDHDWLDTELQNMYNIQRGYCELCFDVPA